MHACFDRARWFFCKPVLSSTHMTQKVQNNIVPWLLSRFGAAYKRDDGPNVVKE